MKDQRQNEIIKLLSVEKSVKTESLASHFNVSMETIRRDINTLERAGLIRKVYGGICLPSDTVHLTALDNWNERLNQYHGEKVRIATKALELIPDYCVIALDIGTTAYELARLLGQKRGLSVITNSLLIAGELARNTSHKEFLKQLRINQPVRRQCRRNHPQRHYGIQRSSGGYQVPAHCLCRQKHCTGGPQQIWKGSPLCILPHAEGGYPCNRWQGASEGTGYHPQPWG